MHQKEIGTNPSTAQQALDAKKRGPKIERVIDDEGFTMIKKK